MRKQFWFGRSLFLICVQGCMCGFCASHSFSFSLSPRCLRLFARTKPLYSPAGPLSRHRLVLTPVLQRFAAPVAKKAAIRKSASAPVTKAHVEWHASRTLS